MRASSVTPVLGIVCLFALSGCKNSCQRVCVQLAEYAEECNLTVSDDELATCIEDNAGKGSSDDRKVCRDYNDPQTIRNEWPCEELELYWGEDNSSDDG